MARKRHHAGAHHSQKHHSKKHHASGSHIGHQPDHFNDEFHHDRDGMRAHFHESYGDGPSNEHERRRMEMENAGMISEDRRAIANLPQGVMIKPYPRTGPYLPEGLDDTISGIDEQMDMDDKQRKAHFFPKKV